MADERKWPAQVDIAGQLHVGMSPRLNLERITVVPLGSERAEIAEAALPLLAMVPHVSRACRPAGAFTADCPGCQACQLRAILEGRVNPGA